jgi:predicted ATPase
VFASIEALNYRCLRYVSQDLRPFQVLVGPNASGKSTFLDTIALLRSLLRDGLTAAIRERSPDLRTLTWMGAAEQFELVVELVIPEERRCKLPKPGYERSRYEVAIGLNAQGELTILGENLWLRTVAENGLESGTKQLEFPVLRSPPDSIVIKEGKHSPRGWRKVLTKKAESGNDYFIAETTNWNNPFRLGPQKLALANLPEDEERFPVATWVKRTLMEGTQRLMLSSEAMRRPAPPGSPVDFQPDGSNLPWVIEDLHRRSVQNFDRWVEHLRTALPDLRTVDTIERPEDRHRYLRVVYENGCQAPSWVVSDGTLRLLALTLLAYLNGPQRVYLIEEPENGIHPLAVEAVFQSLSSAYSMQILCASHSPVILSLAEPGQLLCFAKNVEGSTDIVRGSEHPRLRDWQSGIDLGTLFASGVLG